MTKSSNLPKGTNWLLPAAWMLLIYAFSSRPTLPNAPTPLADLLLKKGAHMAVYAVLVVLWWKAWRTRTPERLALAISWALTVLYAASDEFHQTFVPGRHGWGGDVLIDAGGALLAACGVWFFSRRNARRSSKSDS